MTKKDHLQWAHPLVRDWFLTKFGAATEPQIQGWPSILAGKSTLISAPTGSGKTLTAFLACLNQLVCQAVANELPDTTQALYVSPLKALSNDIEKNLSEPLKEITALAKARNIDLAPIRVAVRTGDTLMRERQAMLKKPPHILITTPESLYILLTAQKSRVMLQNVRTMIVDEIHAVVNDKRGAHLALTLERLEALTGAPIVRIGLSATQKPLEMVASFLAGPKRPMPVIVNIGHARHLELAVEVPDMELSPVASNEMWEEIYNRIAQLAQPNRSTLVFVNTRRLAERVAHHLKDRVGEDKVAAHHGSLSRKIRHDAETRLKNGDLKVLVATASLELGIDIGSIDLVCQIGSPRAIAAALQRVGRAGHWHGAISKGRFFALTRDELVECAALIWAIRQGDLDQLLIPPQPLDVLAQQIVATCATGDWEEAALFEMIKQAYPYANLPLETFHAVIEMLSEGIAGSRGRYGAYLFRDRVNGLVKARRHSRLTAIMSGGAIPDNALYTVLAEPNQTMVGTLDEDFAIDSNRGDIILLGTTSWIIRRVESAGRVLVEDAHGAPPNVPFWRGEAPERSKELSLHVSLLRQKISDFITINPKPHEITPSTEISTAIAWLKSHCGVNDSGAQQIVHYLLQGRAILGAVPTQERIIAERFFDETGGMQLIIHSPFGARINKAWGLALRKRFCRSFNFELQAAATDDGINIALAEQHSFPLADVFHFLHPNTLKEVLVQAVLQSPLFHIRWRWVATRSLSIVRFRNGKKVPPNILRVLSEDLLAAVFPDAAACQDNLAGEDVTLPDHPLINETMTDALTEALDLEGLTTLIKKILSETITCVAIDTPLPSPFAHEILNANPYAFLDDAPLEERRARAVEMRQVLPESVLKEAGRLDPAAISEVKQQAWPDIRNGDELHDALQTLIAIPENALWEDYFAELVTQGRVSFAEVQEKILWVAVEKVNTFNILYPEAKVHHDLIVLEQATPEFEEALVIMMRGWLQHSGPITATELSQKLCLKVSDIDQALLKLESTGLILRGKFRLLKDHPLEWCERRLLARIHRMTIGRLRQEIKPVTAAQFSRWLLKWQHLAPGTQARGEAGLVEVIRQLQGFEAPANAWEKQILAKRMFEYHPGLLDKLCLSGIVGWGRLSPHPATLLNEQLTREEQSLKRVVPRSVAPITFYLREDAAWLPTHGRFTSEEALTGLSPNASAVFAFLKQRGASFLPDIVRGVGRLQAEIETALWELVAAGAITADSFDNLRGLIDPKRRLDKRRRRSQMRFNGGRWTVLYTDNIGDEAKQVEAVCWMLLKRYGVVFRDLLTREKIIPRWRELLMTFRRLEDRGEIRGGRFVSGFIGEQFALPYAIQSLRAIKNEELTQEMVTVAAVDPLNLVGIILPGSRVSAAGSKNILLQDGESV